MPVDMRCAASLSTSASPPPSESVSEIEEVLGGSHLQWYPGHMHSTFLALEQRIKAAHVVIEVRDARLPFSSANPKLNGLIGSKRRVLVFNKADLVPPGSLEPVLRFYAERQQPAIVTQGHSAHNVKRILPLIEQAVSRKFTTIPLNVLVVGYPNVGKSSVINQLREVSVRRAGPRVAPTPGYTRHISGFLVSTRPPLFLLDTPGVMLPSFGRDDRGQRVGLNLALVRAFKDSLVPLDILARFLLLTLNRMTGEGGYRGVLGGMERTEEVEEMVGWVAARIEGVEGLGPGVGGRRGRVEGVKERVVRFLLRKFRTGDMGPVMLDDVEAEMALMRAEEEEREMVARLRKERRAEEARDGGERRIRFVTLDTAPGGEQGAAGAREGMKGGGTGI